MREGCGMRLIDADAFKKYIIKGFEEMKSQFKTEFYLNIATRVTESFLEDIDEQPTVEAPPTSDDEIIKALKAVRTIHNGNYAPQIDEAIRRLTMQKSAYVQVNLSDERIQKAVAEAVEKMKAMIETQPTQPCEDCVRREAVIRLVEQYPSIIGHRCSGLIADIKNLPSATPQRPKGKWLHPYKSDIACECSVCHIQMPITEYYHYCPNCGADMSGGDSE